MNGKRREEKEKGMPGVLAAVNPGGMRLRCLECKHSRMICWPARSWIVVRTMHRASLPLSKVKGLSAVEFWEKLRISFMSSEITCWGFQGYI